MAQLKDLLVQGPARFLNGLSISGSLTLDGHLLPSQDNSYDLGDSSHKWRKGYFKELYVNAGVGQTALTLTGNTSLTGELYVNTTKTQFDIGTSGQSANKFTIGALITGKHISISGDTIQQYSANTTASTLYLQYHGGQLQIGANGTNVDTTMYGGLTVKKSNGFLYEGIGTGTSDTFRVVWFADNNAKGKPVYDDDFVYNPVSNTLKVGRLNITDTSDVSHIKFARDSLNYFAGSGESSQFLFIPSGNISSTAAGGTGISKSALYPLVTNTNSLGTSALHWSIGYLNELAVSSSAMTAVTTNVNGTFITDVGKVVTNRTSASSDGGFAIFGNATTYGYMRVDAIGTAGDGTNQGTQGIGLLMLGNSTARSSASGVGANNAYGILRLYGTNSNYTQIVAQANGNRTVYLPNYNDTMHLVHTANNNAVGAQNHPIYVAANGRITTGAYDLKSSLEEGVANRLSYYKTATQIDETNHYQSTTKIAVNSTSEPTENLYVNGSVKINGNTNIIGTLAFSASNARLTDANIDNTGYRSDKPSMRLDVATSAMTSNKPVGDGYITTYIWDNSGKYQQQLYLSSGAAYYIGLRGCSSGTWSDGWYYFPHMAKNTLTVGSQTNPIYIAANGVIGACTYNLSTTVNSGTASRIAWYNASSQVASGSIVTDGSYLRNIGGYNNTSYQLSAQSQIINSWIRTVGLTGWYNETYSGGFYMIDATWIRNYNNKQLYFGRNTAATATNLSSQLVISGVNSNIATGDSAAMGTTDGTAVGLELWRGSQASWQIINDSGTFKIRNNYTTAKQTTYSQTALILDYNTGAGSIPYLTIGQTDRRTGYRLFVTGGSACFKGTIYHTNSNEATDVQIYTNTVGTAGDGTNKGTQGIAILSIGNATAISSTSGAGANNSRGYLDIYGTGTTQARFYFNDTNACINKGLVLSANNGTTSQVGYTDLSIGNSTASGTANNSQARVYLYGSGKACHILFSDLTGDTNRSVTIPNYAGNIVLAHVSDSSAVGSQTTPVYVAQNGRITACTSIALNANTQTQLQTQRSITLGTAVEATATNFNGAANITIPVTSVKEQYLSWGGRNLSGSFGPLDAALCGRLGQNRWAGIPSSAVTVEYSTDGSTWIDYEASVSQKQAFTTTFGANFVLGKNSTNGQSTQNYKLRVTILADSIYTSLNKFIIYVSTNGSSGAKVTIQKSTYANPTTFTTIAENVGISGWSGFNIVNISKITYGGGSDTTNTSHNKFLRFIFTHNSCSASYKGMAVFGIAAYGGVAWNAPSTLAVWDHVYSFDESFNVTFPATVTATSFAGNATSQSKLTINGGSATQPVYFTGGVPTACTYSLKATLNNATQWGVAYYSTTTNVTSTAEGASGYLLQGNGAQQPSWVQATNANTASTVVKRDASGNFSAGTITATLSGTQTTATKLSSNAGSATQPAYFTGGVPTACTYSLRATVNNATRWGVAYYSTTTNITSSAIGTAGQLLQSGGSAAPRWITATNLATGSTIVKRDANGDFSGRKVYGAVWNDYAEYRMMKEIVEPGRTVAETGTGELILCTARLQPGVNVTSDTFGFSIGQTEKCNTPIAVAGRALVYPLEDRYSYAPGDAVCSGPNGTVSKMTRSEIIEYPERIVGIVSEIPEYETWGSGNVKVNNRIWIKVR